MGGSRYADGPHLCARALPLPPRLCRPHPLSPEAPVGPFSEGSHCPVCGSELLLQPRPRMLPPLGRALLGGCGWSDHSAPLTLWEGTRAPRPATFTPLGPATPPPLSVSSDRPLVVGGDGSGFISVCLSPGLKAFRQQLRKNTRAKGFLGLNKIKGLARQVCQPSSGRTARGGPSAFPLPAQSTGPPGGVASGGEGRSLLKEVLHQQRYGRRVPGRGCLCPLSAPSPCSQPRGSSVRSCRRWWCRWGASARRGSGGPPVEMSHLAGSSEWLRQRDGDGTGMETSGIAQGLSHTQPHAFRAAQRASPAGRKPDSV